MIIKGIKKCLGKNKNLAYRYYLNIDDKTIWSNVYASYSEWDIYYNKYIVEVSRGVKTQRELIDDIKEKLYFLKSQEYISQEKRKKIIEILEELEKNN